MKLNYIRKDKLSFKIENTNKELNLNIFIWKFSFIKNQNNKLINMSKKFKKTITEEVQKQELINGLHKEELEMVYKSASLVNEIEQPIILCSDAEFKVHAINFGEVVMGVPTKMIPYMIQSLTELYKMNLEKHFKGDSKAIQEHEDLIQTELQIVEYFNLEGLDQDDEVKKRNSRVDKLKKILQKVQSGGLEQLSDSDRAEIMQQLGTAAEIAHDASEKLDKGNLTPEQQKELKKETNEALRKHMDEVEGVLLGKVKDNAEDIDLKHIKETFQKYGQQAAKEEIMRVPAEKRDEILRQMVEMFQQGK